MNMKELYENEANRMQLQAETIDKQAEQNNLVWSEKRPLGSSFRSTALWSGVHSHGGVSSDTYGVYIIYRRGDPIYSGEGVLTQRIGLSGYHHKTLLGKGAPPDPSKDSFMTKAYNDEPEFKDYEVSYFVVDTGNKQSNKSLGLMIESYIVGEFNLEETGYNAKGQVDTFEIYGSPKAQKTVKSSKGITWKPGQQPLVRKYINEGTNNKAEFARQNKIPGATFDKWVAKFKDAGLAA